MKAFVRPDDLMRDAFALARDIYRSGYRPDVLLVLWRGGTPVGIVVHEYLLYKGIRTQHTAVKAESYVGIDQRTVPRLEHFDAVLAAIPPGARVLLIDDIFDSGRTMECVCQALAPRTAQVRIATLYYKPSAAQTDLRPDYFVRQTDHWIVFPHELMDLTPDEIRRKQPAIADLLFDEPPATGQETP